MNAIESISTTSNQTESASEELARSTEKQLQAVEVLNDAVNGFRWMQRIWIHQ